MDQIYRGATLSIIEPQGFTFILQQGISISNRI
jgi:hypothetical protein